MDNLLREMISRLLAPFTSDPLHSKKKKKKKKNRGPQVIRELTLTLKDIERTSSVGDQLRDPKLPPYGSLYRGIATDH